MTTDHNNAVTIKTVFIDYSLKNFGEFLRCYNPAIYIPSLHAQLWMYVNVNEHLFYAVFSISLVRKGDHRLSFKQCANISIVILKFWRIFSTSRRRDICMWRILAHLVIWCSVCMCWYVWTFAKPVCVLFVSNMLGIVFSRAQCNHLPQPISEGHRLAFYVPALGGGLRLSKASTHFTECAE